MDYQYYSVSFLTLNSFLNLRKSLFITTFLLDIPQKRGEQTNEIEEAGFDRFKYVYTLYINSN